MKRTILLILLGLGLALGLSKTALAGGCTAVSGVDDYMYHNVIDFTQGKHLNVIVTNTETTPSKSFPLTGACPNPWAGVNPALYPGGTFTPPTPDIYVEVKVDDADLVNGALTGATIQTCNQSDFTLCPAPPAGTENTGSAVEGDVPTTYVHRLGTVSGTTVTPLENDKYPARIDDNDPTPTVKDEPLRHEFTVAGQAFDLDRLRYAANRLWFEWYKEIKTGESPSTNWSAKFGYQPTGTMAFETFIDNVKNDRPMYGLVRVVVPVDPTSEEAWIDSTLTSSQVQGDWFNTPITWNGSAPGNPNEMWSYEGSPNKASSKTITVYGMLLFDYVDESSYDPANFFDDQQDYVDNYPSLADHDADRAAAIAAGVKNFILPRTTGRNIYIKNWDTLNINPVNDLETFVLYTDAHTPGGDGRMDTLDIVRRKYMMARSPDALVNFNVNEISDAYVWEYWMRRAADKDDALYSSRGTIASELATQYNISTQTFTAGAARRTSFDATEWSSLADKDKFHAYFPSGYERGWMIAFDALDLEALDTTVGSWWNSLVDDTTGVGGVAVGKDYPNPPPPAPPGSGRLHVPDASDANNRITVDADGDGDTDVMPNFFLASGSDNEWEDFPALAFAGGVLDIHAYANISGMLYTPDSAEIEAKTDRPAVFQYINGALLFGNGVILEGKDGQNSMIAVAYQYGTFDTLPIGNPELWISPVKAIREILGQ